MKLWEALKIHEESGRKIKPDYCTTFQAPNNWDMRNYCYCDWEVEPEKKKTVTMYKFAFTYDNIHWSCNESFFKDELDFRKNWNPKKVKRLDYTATEFEV